MFSRDLHSPLVWSNHYMFLIFVLFKNKYRHGHPNPDSYRESGLGCLCLYASFLISKETRVVDCYSVWNVRQSIIEKIMESLHFEHNMIKLSWILIDLLNLWSSTLSSTEINLNFEMILEGNEKKIHTNNYSNTTNKTHMYTNVFTFPFPPLQEKPFQSNKKHMKQLFDVRIYYW